MNKKALDIINKTLKEQLNIYEDINIDSKLLDLGIDSIGFMVLIVFLENGLDKEIDIEKILSKEYENITIGDFITEITD